jgi:hypothetical protein
MSPQNSTTASHAEDAPVDPVEQPAEIINHPDEPEPAGDDAPADPEPAAPASQKFTAFDRGALRLLGQGDLIAKLERAESISKSIKADYDALFAQMTALKKETAEKLAAAEEISKTAVSKAVASELQGLGLSAESAPAAITQEQVAKTLSREEFNKLDFAARNEFHRNGGSIV